MKFNVKVNGVWLVCVGIGAALVIIYNLYMGLVTIPVNLPSMDYLESRVRLEYMLDNWKGNGGKVKKVPEEYFENVPDGANVESEFDMSKVIDMSDMFEGVDPVYINDSFGSTESEDYKVLNPRGVREEKIVDETKN